MPDLEWLAIGYGLAAVTAIRIVLAPFWIYREQQAEIAEVRGEVERLEQAKREQEAEIAKAREEIGRLQRGKRDTRAVAELYQKGDTLRHRMEVDEWKNDDVAMFDESFIEWDNDVRSSLVNIGEDAKATWFGRSDPPMPKSYRHHNSKKGFYVNVMRERLRRLADILRDL